MYCIAVLIDEEQKGQDYAEYILNYCADRKIFPLVQIYQDQEKFLGEIQKTVPAIVLLALPGGSRAECCRASSFPAPQMQNNLVQ